MTVSKVFVFYPFVLHFVGCANFIIRFLSLHLLIFLSLFYSRSREFCKFFSWFEIAIYVPMNYTAPFVILLMQANSLQGQVGGGWALKIKTFLGHVNGIGPSGDSHLGPKKIEEVESYSLNLLLFFFLFLII